MRHSIACLTLAKMALITLAVGTAYSQTARWTFEASNVIVPQCRSYSPGPVIQVTRVDVNSRIIDRMATTIMEVSITNPTSSRLEAQLLIPVPKQSVVRAFDFLGKGVKPTARLLRRDEAERIYRSLVSQIRDPALLEFVVHSFVQTSVFPVEPGGPQKIRFVYENLLDADGNRVDFVVPRSESLDYRVPWTVSATIEATTPIASLYSPSHPIETLWHSASAVPSQGASPPLSASKATVRASVEAMSQPGPFRLSILTDRSTVAATILAAPDPKTGGGYFLFLAGAPQSPPRTRQNAQKREVTLVIDRSGSMHGEKMEQVREAALQVISGLREGEAFNIIDYQTGVDQFAPAPVIKSSQTEKDAREYIKAMLPGGGTNIHEALQTALAAAPVPDFLPIVLFLTDGLPTVGQTSEIAIRDLVQKANPHWRRVFAFGVGVDVNTPLLEAIALESRATSAFVLPKENVEVKVADLFKRLTGPVLTDPVLKVVRSDGSDAYGKILDLVPERLPDLFEGEQIVLLGRYVGSEPLHFRLRGNFLGALREFDCRFDPALASHQNSFVPRLWASRRIARLVDAIRRLGADFAANPSSVHHANDARFRELVDEIVRLSTEFGILTEYTAFLAEEGTDLARRVQVLEHCGELLRNRAMFCRSGWASVNQSENNSALIRQKELNPRNAFFDAEMKAVEISTVQQIHDRSFFRKGNRWVDSTVVSSKARPERRIAFGSDEFFELTKTLSERGRAGALALKGEIVLELDGKTVLIEAPANRP